MKITKLKYQFHIVVIKYLVYIYCFMYKMIDFYIFNNYAKILNFGCVQETVRRISRQPRFSYYPKTSKDLWNEFNIDY